MATVSRVSLKLGRVTSAIEFAETTITVRWSSREVQENMYYLLSSFVLEQDDGRDFFDMLPSGNIHWKSIGNLDDFIGTIRKQWVRPSGQSSRTYTWRRNWDFGNQESGNEEYFAVATVVPEVKGDVRFSNRVDINLG